MIHSKVIFYRNLFSVTQMVRVGLVLTNVGTEELFAVDCLKKTFLCARTYVCMGICT